MSDQTPENGFHISDIAAGFSLLTRLPVPVDHELAAIRAAAAAWTYPIVGATLGAIAATVAGFSLWLGAPTGIAAALALAVLVLLTGAMHEDGLADSADGLGGGRDKDHSLAIMKDSRIGAYGAAALFIGLIARWSGIEALGGSGLFWSLITVGAVSRLPMVLAMFLMPLARTSGLSAGVGAPPVQSVFAAAAIALAISVFALGWGGLVVSFFALTAPLPLFWLAHKKINGQTGDVLGGSQQLAEIAALAAVFAAA
jgi:adenosylcobinamide-GDP ribazoletransferase